MRACCAAAQRQSCRWGPRAAGGTHLGRLLPKADDVPDHAQERRAQQVAALRKHGVQVAHGAPVREVAAIQGVGKRRRRWRLAARAVCRHAYAPGACAAPHHSSRPPSMDRENDMSDGSVSTLSSSRNPTRWGYVVRL